jgi:hypothetical protein
MVQVFTARHQNERPRRRVRAKRRREFVVRRMKIWANLGTEGPRYCQIFRVRRVG